MKFKKLMALILTMAMVMTLMPAAMVAAGGNHINGVAASYTPEQPFSITVTGLTDEQINDQEATVGIYETARTSLTADAVNGRMEYISNLDGAPFETYAPTAFANYEIRLIVTIDGKATLLEKIPFSVASAKASAENITISKPKLDTGFLPSDEVTVTITGLAQTDIEDNNAWAGIFEEGTKVDGEYIEKVLIKRDLPDATKWKFRAPTTFGKYEVRIFTQDDDIFDVLEHRTNAFYGKVSFTVASNRANPGDIMISKGTFKMGEPVQVTIINLTQGQIKDGAWAGVFMDGDMYGANFLDQATIDGLRDGKTWTFNAPLIDPYRVPKDTGKYEVRVFTQGDVNDLLTLGSHRELAYYGKVTFNVVSDTFALPDSVPSTWAVIEIDRAKLAGLITEKLMSANYQLPITREEFCELAIKFYEKMSGKTAAAVAINPFTDVTNPEVLKAYNLGIVKGVSDNKFAPDNNVTRQEMAVMLLRALKAVKPTLNTSDAKFTETFIDVRSIAPWALEAVRFFNANGIIKGGNSMLEPTTNTTREAAIVMVNRVYEKFSGK